MSNELAKKLSEDMAYAILTNKEINSHVEAALTFFSCVDVKHTVSSGIEMDIVANGESFTVDTNSRSLFEVLVEVCLKSYYSQLVK